jgi:hypothetical protein
MGTGGSRGPDRQILKHSGPARDRDQDHHAGEQADRIPVDALERLLLVYHADKDHRAAADERHDGTIDLLGDDDSVGD